MTKNQGGPALKSTLDLVPGFSNVNKIVYYQHLLVWFEEWGLFTKWRRSGPAGHFCTRVHAGCVAGWVWQGKTHLRRATFCTFCLNTLRVILTDDLCVRRTWKIKPEKDLGYVHTYPGLFENGAFRPRIHRNGHTYPHVSGAFWKRSGPKTELFENAPESGSFGNGGFGSGSFLRVNMVSGSFLPLSSRRSKLACPSDEYCFTCICSFVAETGSSSFFLFRRKLPSKTKRRMVAVVFRSNSTSSAFLDEGRVFLFLFHFASSFVCVSFCLWSLSFITCLHDSQSTYTCTILPRGTSTWSNTEEQHWQAKETNKKKCDLSSRRVRTQRPWFSGGGTFPRINPRPCERGLRIDVRYVWTPQNGSFRKRIFLVYVCT